MIKKVTAEQYQLIVDYDQSVEEAIDAGKYDYYDNNITLLHSPIECFGRVNMKVMLVHFVVNTINTDIVLDELDKRDLRPAELCELLAFGAKFPERQKRFSILGIGSFLRNHSGNYNSYPCLSGESWRRGLFLRSEISGIYWFGSNRFAAVHKQGYV